MCRPFPFVLACLTSLACPVAACLGAEPAGSRTIESLPDNDTSVPLPPAAQSDSNSKRSPSSVDDVITDPGNLTAYRDQPGKRIVVRVVGDTRGPIWGGDNDTYTDDSRLASAAVHAGVLSPGEEGIVEVRILPGRDTYEGSRRNGVTSYSWQWHGGSYRITSVNRALPASVQKVLQDAAEEFRQQRTLFDKANARTLEKAEQLLRVEQERLSKAGLTDEAAAVRDELHGLRESLIAKTAGSSSASIATKAGPVRRENLSEPNGHPLEFELRNPKSPLAPRISPKATQINLLPTELAGIKGQDHLIGRIPLGVHAVHGDGQLIALGRTKGDRPYDLLFIDTDLDDDLADEKPVAASPKVIRDKWWSSFEGELKAIHSEGPDGAIAYPVSIWVTAETPEETPSLVRYTRRGFSVANIIIEGIEYTVLVSDGNNDGVIGKGDFWRIDGDNPQASTDWRRMPDHCWAEGKAWKLVMEGTDGRSGTLYNFDAGRTQADDDAARDPYRADKDAPRAKTPLKFEDDFEVAMKKAADANQPCFLEFQTEWCGPCRVMEELVFTAKEVVTAAEGIVCVRVDGDKRKDLAEKYRVTGYPAGIMLDATGKEIGRTGGYQSVKKMSAFFLEHK
jgi:hypothetical protein